MDVGRLKRYPGLRSEVGGRALQPKEKGRYLFLRILVSKGEIRVGLNFHGSPELEAPGSLK